MVRRVTKPLVSIVIPVYNAELYLRRCIDSLLQQTYEPIQIILIDDGSKDDSGNICDLYSYDNAVTVIHTENRGVSSARNTGIEQAKGEYILFVDSDDDVSPQFVEHLMEADAHFDYVVAGGVYYYEQSHTEAVVRYDEYNVDIDTFRSQYIELRNRVPHNVVWGVRYRKEIIKDNQISFDQSLTIGEDVEFNLRYLLHCDNLQVINYSEYHYFQRGDGTVLRYHPDRLEQLKKVTQSMQKFNQQEGFESIIWFNWNYAIQHYKKHLQLKSASEKDIKCRLRQTYHDPYFRKCLPFIKTNGTLDMKLYASLIEINLPYLYDPMINIVMIIHRLKQKWKKTS